MRQRELERQEQRNRKIVNLGLASRADMNVIQAGLQASLQAAAAGAACATAAQAQAAKVKEMTGVELPSYYNPTAINPLQFAEQIKKRKMLWSKKSDESAAETSQPSMASLATAAQPRGLALLGKPKAAAAPAPAEAATAPKASFNQWEATNFGDNQANEKFRRLMGIKGSATPSGGKAPSAAPTSSKKMFEEQEMQYEKARAITHTQRGLGLGFSHADVYAQSHAPPTHETSSSSQSIPFVRKS